MGVKFTAGRIANFTSLSGQSFLWDSVVAGLAVRAIAGSKGKAFIWQRKIAGKTVRITIGDVRKWDIDQARERARDFHVMVDKGIDPREVKKGNLQALKQKRIDDAKLKVTVLDAFKGYIKIRKSKWGTKHLAHHMNFMDAGGKAVTRGRRPGQSEFTRPGALYPLMNIPLSELDADAIAAWLKKESARAPTLTAQAYRALKAFMSWCADDSKEYGFVDGTICKSKVVKEGVPKVGTKTGDCLQREQLKPWFKEVSNIGNSVISAYLQTLLLTGPRREELAMLKWDDVDFQWGSMTIRDKVEGVRTIPLTPYVSSLLSGLPRRNEWVFSTTSHTTAPNGKIRKKGWHITEPRKAHVAALAAANLPHISLQGLRRSFGTLADWVEIPVGVVAQIQGHKPSALAEKHYRRRPIDLLRKWHTEIEKWILTEAGIEFDSEEQKKQPPVAPTKRRPRAKSKAAA